MSPHGRDAGRVRPVPLDGVRRAWLGALTGADEEAASGIDTEAALALLDRLLVDRPGTAARPGEAARLTVTDRDLLLAAVHRVTFGARIEASVACTACGAPFDLDFDLDALVADAMTERPPAPADGFYGLPGGLRFRLPTGEDEQAVSGLPTAQAAAALAERCCPGGTPADTERLEAAMAAAGPVLDLPLTATCPECGAAQSVRFAMQVYLLGRLAQEAPRRLAEIHRVAGAYHWSLAEILSLRRDRRRALAALAAGERPPVA